MLTILISCNSITDLPKIPYVDLGFAISATATSAGENYLKMKEIMKEIVDKYGLGRVRYTVITFGRNSDVKIRFNDNFPSEEKLKTFLEAVPRSSGGADLAQALERAKEVFSEDSRPEVKKILVVIIDKKSDSKVEDVRKAATHLDDNDVTVIGVALHDEADLKELGNITTNNRNLIVANSTASPTQLAEEIMSNALKGESFNLLQEYAYIT